MIIFNSYLTPRLVLSHIWPVPLIFRAIACKLTICLSQGNRSHQVETTRHASSTAVCWCSGGLCSAASAKGVHRLGLETIWTHMKTGLRCTKAEAFDQRCLQGCWFCVRKGWTCTLFCQQHSHHKPFHYVFQFMTIVIPMSPLWYMKTHQKTSVFSDFQVKKKHRDKISQTNPLGGSTAGQSDNLQQRLRQHQQRFGDRLEDVLLVPVVSRYIVNEGLEFEGFHGGQTVNWGIWVNMGWNMESYYYGFI